MARKRISRRRWSLAPGLDGLEERLVLSGQAQQVAGAFDLVLILDGTDTLTPADFQAQKDWAAGLISALDVDFDAAHVGLVQFAGLGAARVELGLSGDLDEVLLTLADMAQIGGGPAYYDESLALARQELEFEGRAGLPQLVVLVTADPQGGFIGGDPVDEADRIKEAGGIVLAVGVGPEVDVEQLAAIVSTPAAENLFLANNFEALAEEFVAPVADRIAELVAGGPVVTSLVRFGYHAMATNLVVGFDQDMDRASVENTDNYTLVWLGRDGVANTFDDHVLPIDSAAYDPDTRSVTIRPVNRLPIRWTFVLIINGTAPDGVRNAAGTLLDGSGTGIPGTDYVRTFGAEITVIPSPHPDTHPVVGLAVPRAAQAAALPRGPLRRSQAAIPGRRAGRRRAP